MGMNAREFDVQGVKLILPKRFSDARGYFCETWNDRIFRQEIANVAFVQDNWSVSAKKGTSRGLHFQKPPFAQGKLVRTVRGSILDIAFAKPGGFAYIAYIRGAKIHWEYKRYLIICAL
jgi:dTDP-4-dehydrorhamnose 3,5-epimerase